MLKRNIHVVPHQGGWAAQKEGAERASFVGYTKAEVEARARAQARAEHTELFIHGRNGRIQDRDSYGNDPCPPKDTKR